MQIELTVNGKAHTVDVPVNQRLLHTLRSNGYFGVKHGCETGECGACAVLIKPAGDSGPGKLVNSCVMLAAQANGSSITTIEAIGEHPEQGWRQTEGLHPLQQAFVETGAIQCGFCTPAMVLAAWELLARNPAPDEAEVREALSGVLCRCTGYIKPVQAILRAAAVMRGEAVAPLDGRPEGIDWPRRADDEVPGTAPLTLPDEGGAAVQTTVLPPMVVTPETSQWASVGKPEKKVDAVKLVQGKPAFADDLEMRGMLHAKVLWSPVAHAKIKRIDVSKARALPGVAAVLTWKDIPRVVYSTAGQSDPIPGPLDMFSLDERVRYVGDRVAFVAAETVEIAERALELIEVEYEELLPVLDPRDAMLPDAPRIHPEPEYVPFADSDPTRNLAAEIQIDIGDVDAHWDDCAHIFDSEYIVPRVQQAAIEPHIVVTWWDEDDRLVIRTSTQVPFHVRRILAPVLELPVKRIRVIKPRIGGGFGGKQEVMIEDVAAHLTIATGRPVRFEYTRAEEFFAARSRHPMRVRMRTGVTDEGQIVCNEMYALSDTGAYGCHALTVTGNTGHKSMALYNAPNIRFYADVVYTNTPPAGAYRGYGVPQGFFPVEQHIERIARERGWDPVQFRLKNAIKPGDLHPFSTAWSEGREPRPETIETCALEQCVAQGAAQINWQSKFENPDWHAVPGQPHLRRGIGIATVMQGTAIPYLDMGGASIKLNDDGSFNCLVGATDLGTGSDTVLGQMAAEILGCPLEDVLVYSSDTDFTPFDKGAYASSTTYISGAAVCRAAEAVARQMRLVAARMLNARGEGGRVEPQQLTLRDRAAWAADGRSVTHAEIALNSLHHEDQHQIMGIGSYMSKVSPPPFAAQFAEVTVDVETGQVTVDNLVMVVDSGVIVNPATASGQIEGGMTQALGYAVCEEMLYDDAGRSLVTRLGDYRLFSADEMPNLVTIFVETFEQSHPFGVKAVAEIPMDGVAPAVANAIFDAVGVWLPEIPATPERVWQGIQALRPD